MDNRNPIVPYHDPTADDHPSVEQILSSFGNEEPPSLSFDQFPGIPGPSSINANMGVNPFPQVPGPSSSSSTTGLNQFPQFPGPSSSNANMASNQSLEIPGQSFSNSNMGFYRFPEVPGPSLSNANMAFNQFPGVPGPVLSNVNTGFNQFSGVPGPGSSNTDDNNRNVNNPVLFPQSSSGGGGGGFWNANDPASVPFSWNNMLPDSSGNGGQFGAGSSSAGNYNNIPQSAEFGNPIQLNPWPLLPSPYTCSSCQTLREIVHTNGIRITNLEIHGRLGMFSHAILDKYDFDFSNQNHEYVMYDFSQESITRVKDFLVQYCEFRNREGYFVVPDSLSTFYNALSVGIDGMENYNTFFQPNVPMASGSETMPQQEDSGSQQNAANNVTRNTGDERQQNQRQEGESSRGGTERGRITLAKQRERTAKMTLHDFSKHFNLSITEAARQMEVSATVIKKKCREAGILRWPYRKIKGIKRKIASKREALAAANEAEKAPILADIQMLQQELKNMYQSLTNPGSQSNQGSQT